MSKSHKHPRLNITLVSGQAHFCGTGPPGRTCRQCTHWWHDLSGYDHKGFIKPARCRQFTALTNQLGARVPADTPACKYFAPTNDLVPVPFISPQQLRRGHYK
jgi:hypothetical protein